MKPLYNKSKDKATAKEIIILSYYNMFKINMENLKNDLIRLSEKYNYNYNEVITIEDLRRETKQLIKTIENY